MRQRLTLLALVVLPVFACGTRVIDLELPADGGATVPAADQCELVKRADGTLCKVCFLPDGDVFNAGCEPPAKVNTGSAVVSECKVALSDDTRCLICDGPAGAYMPCLRCEAPVTTSSAGDSCRACSWSDAPERRCLQCFAGGKTTADDCNSLRSERLAGP